MRDNDNDVIILLSCGAMSKFLYYLIRYYNPKVRVIDTGHLNSAVL